jgi:hypothetical protein
MTVQKFTQPDSSTAPTGNDYAEDIDASISVLQELLGSFAPFCSEPPAMEVNIGPGRLKHEFGLGAAPTISQITLLTSSTIVAPSANPRIDRIGIDAGTSQLIYFQGIEAASPVAPRYADGVIPICAISLEPGQTVITNFHITDERSLFDMEFGNTASLAGDTGAYNDVAAYRIFTTAGSYSLTKPTDAKYMRLTFGAGGGGGGGAIETGGFATYCGGGGGGGSVVSGLTVAAQDISFTVGAAGTAGLGNTPAGTNNATAGGPGGDTTVTMADGTVYTTNGGLGGGRATTTPTQGAGGAGGAATHGGFAGAAGASASGGGGGGPIPGAGGNAGENQNLGRGFSLVLPSAEHGLCFGGIGGQTGGFGLAANAGSAGFLMVEWW